MRALRTIPIYVRFAEAIKQNSPDAWIINYTNPMSLCVKTLYLCGPVQAVVETNAVFERDAIRPILAGDLPECVKELIMPAVENHEAILEAALTCNEELVVKAFMNDPQIVAQAAKNVIREYLYSFKNIEFAVYCSPRDDRNYRIFDRVLKK